MLYLHYQPLYMPKFYKIFVLFVGLVAMNINVQARLEGDSTIFSPSVIATKNKLTSWNSLIYPFGFKEVSNFTNYPNPAITETTISYTLSAKANVNLRVIDLAGKQLAVLIKQDQSAGKQEYFWELAKNNITSGMYILVLQVDGKIFSRKVIVQ